MVTHRRAKVNSGIKEKSYKHHPLEMNGISQLEKALAMSSTVKRMVNERLRMSRIHLRVVLLPSGFTRLLPNCDSMIVQAKLWGKKKS